MATWIANLAAGLVIAVATSVLTVRLALGRFHAERWWERKAEAYTEILNALSDLKHYAEILARKEQGAKYTDEFEARLRERHRDAYDKLRSATTVGGFILAGSIAQRLEDLARQAAAIEWEDVPPWEYYEENAKAYSSAIADVRTAAKKDLQVP